MNKNSSKDLQEGSVTQVVLYMVLITLIALGFLGGASKFLSNRSSVPISQTPDISLPKDNLTDLKPDSELNYRSETSVDFSTNGQPFSVQILASDTRQTVLDKLQNQLTNYGWKIESIDESIENQTTLTATKDDQRVAVTLKGRPGETVSIHISVTSIHSI